MSTTAIRQVPAGTWTADPIHSSMSFAVKHMGVATFRGGFTDHDVRLVAEDDGGLRLEGTARVESIDVQEESLRTHLLAPEFFDAEHHPEISFRASSIEVGPDGELTVEGDLTIKGISRAVRAHGTLSEPGPDPYGNERIGLSLEAVVDRTEFGLDWNQELPSGGPVLDNEVTLSVESELVKAT